MLAFSCSSGDKKHLLGFMLFVYCCLLLLFLVEARQKFLNRHWLSALTLVGVFLALLLHEVCMLRVNY